jgi:hypothetical protein
LNQPCIDRIFEKMTKWANVVAACFAIVAIMYLFVLPAVNPPVSTGAQWISLHAPLPTSAATPVVLARPTEHTRIQDLSAASFDILELDSVLRC